MRSMGMLENLEASPAFEPIHFQTHAGHLIMRPDDQQTATGMPRASFSANFWP